jgi:hypothetical protein
VGNLPHSNSCPLILFSIPPSVSLPLLLVKGLYLRSSLTNVPPHPPRIVNIYRHYQRRVVKQARDIPRDLNMNYPWVHSMLHNYKYGGKRPNSVRPDHMCAITRLLTEPTTRSRFRRSRAAKRHSTRSSEAQIGYRSCYDMMDFLPKVFGCQP